MYKPNTHCSNYSEGASISIHFSVRIIPEGGASNMLGMFSLRAAFIIAIFGVFSWNIAAQEAVLEPARSQEVSESDGIPVLIKHLPQWESIQDRVVFATDVSALRSALGDRPILNQVELNAGAEAAAANYDAGTLLIIEYTTPQAASDANFKFNEFLTANPGSGVVHRRIGNYSVLVLDASDVAAADALLDQVKYEKSIQWLGEDPFLLQKFERYFAVTSRDVAVSTVLWISGGIGLAIFLGIIAGLLFFLYREKERQRRTAFSDAGGLTRLNLDGLSEPMPGK
jgi:hypothetical protein